MSPKLYIIAGCNGAGKTTASMTVLPEILGCREFNAIIIADNERIYEQQQYLNIISLCQNRKEY